MRVFLTMRPTRSTTTILFFFFKQKTAYEITTGDWSSDVCSSDLRTVGEAFETIGRYLPTMVDATVHGMEVSDGIVFVYSYYIDPLMMSYRQKADWAIAFACNLIRVGLGDPRWTPQEVLLPKLADETPAERRARAEIMGENIRVGHPWAGFRFDAALLKRPMATADAMTE